MIVLGGCILSMGRVLHRANRRAQRLSENAEDLHGSARLAAPEDIEATGICGTRVAFTWVAGTRTQPADCSICATTARNTFSHLPPPGPVRGRARDPNLACVGRERRHL